MNDTINYNDNELLLILACLFGQTGFMGNDIQLDTGITTSQDCKDICDQNQNCLAWTYDIQDQICHLKASVTMPKYLDSTLTSGLKYCTATMPDCYEESIDYQNNNLAHQFHKDWNECQEWCDQTAGCTHITYDTRHPTCYLKTGDNGRRNYVGIVSAPNQCNMQFEG